MGLVYWTRRQAQGLVASFLAFGLPARFMLAAVFAAITGSGYLGTVYVAAAWKYSLRSGVRLPIDGLPFLHAGVAFGSFAFLFISGVVLFLVIALSEAGWWALAGRTPMTQRNEYRAQALGVVIPRWSVAWIAITILVTALLSAPERSIRSTNIVAAAFLATTVVGVLVYGYAPNAHRLLAVITVSATTILGPLSLFVDSVYTEVLRISGYGGCIPIVVAYGTDKESSTTLAGQLVIRTSLSLIVNTRGTIVEVPFANVVRLDYMADGDGRCGDPVT